MSWNLVIFCPQILFILQAKELVWLKKYKYWESLPSTEADGILIQRSDCYHLVP